jgi:hypothetical protein
MGAAVVYLKQGDIKNRANIKDILFPALDKI